MDEAWIALCCFMETAKNRRDENMKAHQREIEEKEKREDEMDCARHEYLERDWEHG